MFISWIAVTRLQTDAYSAITSNQYLDVRPNPGFLKFLGIPPERAYQPWAIKPQIEVWQAIERRVRQFGGRATGRSSVLELSGPGDTVEQIVTFSARLYRPNILVVEVRLRKEINISIEEVFEFRPIDAFPVVRLALNCLIGMINSGSTKKYNENNSFFVRPIIFFPIDIESNQFPTWLEQHENMVASILINNSNYALANRDLSKRLFEKSKEANVKFSGGACILVSKQGIVTTVAARDPELIKNIKTEHKRRSNLFELALASEEFLSHFLQYRQENEDLADFLLFLGLPMYSEGARIYKTVTGTFVWQELQNDVGILSTFKQIDEHFLEEIQQKTKYFQQMNQEDYHAIGFEEKLQIRMRKFHRNWLQRTYERHTVLPWLIGIAIATVAAMVGMIKAFSH